MSDSKETNIGHTQISLKDKLTLKGALKASGTTMILAGIGFLANAGIITNGEISKDLDSMVLPYPQTVHIPDAGQTVVAYENQVKELALSGSGTINITSDVSKAYQSLQNDAARWEKGLQLDKERGVNSSEQIAIALLYTGPLVLAGGVMMNEKRKNKVRRIPAST